MMSSTKKVNRMGRPAGSLDQRPRERRDKLQHSVDRFLGVKTLGKRQLRVALQQPCERCHSCMHVSYLPKTTPEIPISPFIVEALTRSTVDSGL